MVLTLFEFKRCTSLVAWSRQFTVVLVRSKSKCYSKSFFLGLVPYGISFRLHAFNPTLISRSLKAISFAIYCPDYTSFVLAT